MEDASAAPPEARRIVLRIGINLGDIVVDGGDLYGDGVNIAARLESLAEPGAIYVSAGIRDQVRRKLPFDFDDLGSKSLKNIDEPVHVYRVLYEPAAAAGHEQNVFTDGLTARRNRCRIFRHSKATFNAL